MSTIERPPIACTLGREDLAARLARIRQLTREHLRSHELQGTTLRLHYNAVASEELAQIVELERQCCAFLDFDLSTKGAEVELVVEGPAHAAADAQWLFSQFLPESHETAAKSTCACSGG
jgi:hypothetical protein